MQGPRLRGHLPGAVEEVEEAEGLRWEAVVLVAVEGEEGPHPCS